MKTKMPRLYSLRCFDIVGNCLYQKWDFADYLDYCDTLCHIFAENAQYKIGGCYFQSVVVFSEELEIIVWEKRYE